MRAFTGIYGGKTDKQLLSCEIFNEWHPFF